MRQNPTETTGSIAGDLAYRTLGSRLAKCTVSCTGLVVGAFVGQWLTPSTLPFVAHCVLVAPWAGFSLWYTSIMLHDVLTIWFGPD